ncbi:Helix-turn-helix [Ruminococcaceae bacterium YRB3002]|nr:Helix-turn-helix [Ruminococcaceae bacterium YRB3002]
MTKNTDELMNILKSANDTQILDDVLAGIDGTSDFKTYINNILLERDWSIADLQRRSCIARTYMYQIMDGTRNPGRDKVILIALALEIDVTETMRLLKLTSNPVLYPKNRRDAILIYALNNKLTVADCNRLLATYEEAELT